MNSIDQIGRSKSRKTTRLRLIEKLWLNAPEPRVAVKCDPGIAIELRERYRGIEPAYHMNKRMWNDLYMNRDLEDEDIKKWIKHSYDEVVKKLPKIVRHKYQLSLTEDE